MLHTVVYYILINLARVCVTQYGKDKSLNDLEREGYFQGKGEKDCLHHRILERVIHQEHKYILACGSGGWKVQEQVAFVVQDLVRVPRWFKL